LNAKKTHTLALPDAGKGRKLFRLGGQIMKKYSNKSLVRCCVLSVTATLLVVGILLFAFFGGVQGLSFIWKTNLVRGVIDGQYVGEVDWEALETAVARTMVNEVGDRWSYYMTEEEYESYTNYSNNTSFGIGVTIKLDEQTEGFVIDSVTEGSPADEAGIIKGQIIIAVEGQSVIGKEIAELREIMQTYEGEFEITLLSGEEKITATVYLTNIFKDPISYEMKENNVGYIKIDNFETGASDGAQKAVEALADQGATSLIFDVRSNPGGKLTELIALLDYILPEGDIFISVSKNGSEKISTSDAQCIDYPIVVLLDADSYSAAEFFAAALSEYDYATLIGEQSTGKGRSQSTFVLYDGSAVHISTKRYLTPNRVDLSVQGGLTPDIEIALDGEKDTQLEEAIKYLS